jgi:hypothetical protein
MLPKSWIRRLDTPENKNGGDRVCASTATSTILLWGQQDSSMSVASEVCSGTDVVERFVDARSGN